MKSLKAYTIIQFLVFKYRNSVVFFIRYTKKMCAVYVSEWVCKSIHFLKQTKTLNANADVFIQEAKIL